LTLETLIQIRRHIKGIDMALEREIDQMQEANRPQGPKQIFYTCPRCMRQVDLCSCKNKIIEPK
jgi:hypothetical protein